MSARILKIENRTHIQNNPRSLAIQGDGGFPSVTVLPYGTVELDLSTFQLDAQFCTELADYMDLGYCRSYLDNELQTSDQVRDLAYITTGAAALGAIETQSEHVAVNLATKIINFVGPDVIAVQDGADANKVNVYIPPLSFSPHLGDGQGSLNWPSTSLAYVDRPEGGAGIPYFTNGWDDLTPTRSVIRDISPFSSGLGITHTSPRVTDLHTGQIDVIITDGNGTIENVSLVLSPLGGDQDAFSAGGNVSVHVRDTIDLGLVIEGKVYIDVDVAAFLATTQTGTGGYFYIAVAHTAAPAADDFGAAFWDDGAAPNGSLDPTLSVNVAAYKYLSGVPWLTTGTTLDISDSPAGVNDVVNMTIEPDKDIINVNASELNVSIGEVNFDDSSISGLSFGPGQSPIRTETPSYFDTVTIGSGNYRTMDAQVHTTWHNWFGNEAGSPKSSASVGLMIDTYGNTATMSIEYFDDELYRLQDEDNNTFAAALVSYTDWLTSLRDWDSTENIDSGTVGHEPGLQVGMGVLQYPTVNYSTDHIPVGPNYSGLTGDRFYYRAFYVGDVLTHKNFTISLNVSGFTTGDVDVGFGGDDSTDLRVDFRTPGPLKTPMDGANNTIYPGSGWLHCGKQYNSSVFVGNDNDGCLVSISQAGNTITLNCTTENISSEYCNGVIIVRIRVKDSVGASKTLTSMSVTGA